MGITGRMLRWVQNFLSSRTARCHIQDTAGPVFTTTVGLSQGTVLSPIFFNIYIKDMYENSGKLVKFADDGTIWEQDMDPLVAVLAIGRKAANWKLWCRKWKMTINFTKTEGTVFSRAGPPNIQLQDRRGNNWLQSNTKDPGHHPR